MPFSFHIKITVAPENAEKFLAALKPVFEGFAAEPECTYFEVFQDPENPGTFRLVENWNATKEQIFEVQLKKDYYKSYAAETEPLWIKPREVEVWERMPSREWTKSKRENFM
ncbi:uncharacterized protein K441DRAFT_554130 [Cenococcum geophilum 1.58]|uniref:uncharacterized protein n=1 Tax=Cenococcum geophilum 1.58 TaxID=794803 RepID=UPI00358E92C6|nr:hypothetical protein K441DRAFT_554130 [Cenococcum geophilum 1.58]